MTKRHLNEKQQQRIDEKQQTIQECAQTGLLIAHYGHDVDIEAVDKTIVRCRLRQNLPALVVGDHVVWEEIDETSGVIVAQLPRDSILCRPNSRGQVKPVAANVNQIIITLAIEPDFSMFLLDCYLAAATLNRISPIILINKIDLLDDQRKKTLEARINVYKALNYSIFLISSKADIGLTALDTVLDKHQSVFVGPSGVGKSSLITHFVSENNIAVGEISLHTQLGRHTTTTSRLYYLKNRGTVIDSPGVREFGLGEISKAQLLEAFFDIKKHQGQCKFRDCQHDKEPECAIKQALMAGEISASRWESFKKLQEQEGIH